MARLSVLLLVVLGTLVVLGLAGMAVARPTWDKLDGYTFEHFVRDFGALMALVLHALQP